MVSEAAKSEEWVHSLVKTLVWVVSREHTGSPLLPVLEELNVISENGLRVCLACQVCVFGGRGVEQGS